MLAATALYLIVSFCWPRTITFSYSQPNCFANPVVLPNLVSRKPSHAFKATLSGGITIAGHQLFSSTTCITPVQSPSDKTEVVVLGSIIKKNVRVTPGTLPAIQNTKHLKTPIPTKESLTLQLDRADSVFEYRLRVDDKNVLCTKRDRTLTCALAKLNLAQSTNYTLTLERLFKGKTAGAVLQTSFSTVGAVQVTGSSIAADQILYNAPTDISLTLNKAATSYKGAHLYLVAGDTRQELPITTKLDGTTVTIHIEQPLPRSASLLLSIDQITAPDGGYLNTAYVLSFKTSGGPKVLGVSIGSYKVQPTSSVVITFDSALAAGQSTGNFVRLEANGNAVATTIKVSGKSVTLTPNTALGRCVPLTVKVLDGLQNEFGISGGSTWQYRSRTLCQTVFSIGTSVQGRAITAYGFGSGPNKIIFVGAMHGDEKSSAYTLNAWVDYLEANALSIPASRTIIVVPIVNPDGFAAGTRLNAHGVDLNRNFPANDWKSDVTMPDQTFHPGGGGSAPLSEPESSALASYVLGQNPSLVLTYHAIAGVVIPNDSGNSVALAQTYDQKSNVYFSGNDETDSIFTYDTTGAFEGWLHDQPDIPALLVELWTMSGNEFGKHQNAMWTMLQ